MVGQIVDNLLQMERLCRSVDALLPERYRQLGSATIKPHGLDEQHHLEVSHDGVGSAANADGRDRLFALLTTQFGGMAARIERARGTAFRVSFADLEYRNRA